MTDELRTTSARQDDRESTDINLDLIAPYEDPARRMTARERARREVPFSMGISRSRLKSRGAAQSAEPARRG